MFKSRFVIALFIVCAGIIALVLTVSGAVLVDVVSSFGEKEPETQPAAFPRIADPLRADLNSALSPEFPINFDGAGNPFADKSGVSLQVTEKQTAASAVPGARPVGITNLPGSFNGALPVSGAPVPIGMPSGNVQSQAPMVQSGDGAVKERLQERDRLRRQGVKDLPDVASLYDIEDVRPVGIVGSGDSNRVIFYSPATKQTFSAGRGAKFRNGTLEGLDDEGVKFKGASGGSSNRWMKNSERKADTADAPIVRVPDN